MQKMVFPDFTAIIAVSRAEYAGRWRKIILENRQNFLKSLKTNPIPSQFPFKFPIGIKSVGFSSESQELMLPKLKTYPHEELP